MPSHIIDTNIILDKGKPGENRGLGVTVAMTLFASISAVAMKQAAERSLALVRRITSLVGSAGVLTGIFWVCARPQSVDRRQPGRTGDSHVHRRGVQDSAGH